MKRWLRWIAVAVIGLIVVGVVALRIRYRDPADIGAGYGAKQLCSCIFVGGRDYEACRRDLGPEMKPVRTEVVGEAVRAWVPLLASRTARFQEPTGCTLE
jgi:hypothetical protein